MKCPYCSSENTRVIDSRPADDNNSIRRRRLCDDCGKRFTTYEKVDLSYKDTTPSARHMRVGEPSIRPEDEWNGGKFGLNFGERYSFIHKPIQMKRNDKDVLVGREVVS